MRIRANGLKRVMKAGRVRPEDLSAVASRSHLFDLMAGRTTPSLPMAVALAECLTRKLGRPVGMAELFDLGAAAKARKERRRRVQESKIA